MRFQFYHEPASLRECVQIMANYGTDAKPLAGGTDLVVKLRAGVLKPKAVIGLQKLKEMTTLAYAPDGSLEIGAMSTLRQIAACKLLAGPYELIREGARHVSSMQVRNVATLGGNTCNASPSADTVPGTIASDARVRLLSNQGERTLSLEDFFVGPSISALLPGEVLLSFIVPAALPYTGGSYQKYAIRGDADISIMGVAARLSLGDKREVREARIVMAAVAPIPLRARKAENLLVGQQLTEELIEQAAVTAMGESRPITDQRATAAYRKEMIRVWTRYALKEALHRAS
jgi:carbon-monoxide dehydrogenase medium subunit